MKTGRGRAGSWVEHQQCKQGIRGGVPSEWLERQGRWSPRSPLQGSHAAKPGEESQMRGQHFISPEHWPIFFFFFFDVQASMLA